MKMTFQLVEQNQKFEIFCSLLTFTLANNLLQTLYKLTEINQWLLFYDLGSLL